MLLMMKNLIGSDYYWSVVTGETVRGGVDGPVAVHTRLGWILSGPIPHIEEQRALQHMF